MPSGEVREDLVIGVDIGGTKIAAGLVDPSGKVLSHSRNQMVCSDGADRALAAVTPAIETVSAPAMSISGDRNLIRGIGICSPGPLDPKTGVVINPPNLRFLWSPLVTEKTRELQVAQPSASPPPAAVTRRIVWLRFRIRNNQNLRATLRLRLAETQGKMKVW